MGGGGIPGRSERQIVREKTWTKLGPNGITNISDHHETNKTKEIYFKETLFMTALRFL